MIKKTTYYERKKGLARVITSGTGPFFDYIGKVQVSACVCCASSFMEYGVVVLSGRFMLS